MHNYIISKFIYIICACIIVQFVITYQNPPINCKRLQMHDNNLPIVIDLDKQ